MTDKAIKKHEDEIKRLIIEAMEKNKDKPLEKSKLKILGILMDYSEKHFPIKHGPLRIESTNDDGSMFVSGEIYL